MSVIKFLVANGANVNHENSYGANALMWAIDKINIQIINVLLTNNVDINHKNSSGTNALMWAIYQRNIEMINVLLLNGADINHANHKRKTLLHLAIEPDNLEILHLAATKGYIKTVTIWITTGANINHENQNSDTALNIIIHNGLQNKLEDLFYEEYKEFLLNIERENVLKNHLISSTELFQNNSGALEDINFVQYLNTDKQKGNIAENLTSVGLTIDDQKINDIKNYIAEWFKINKSEINSIDLQNQPSTSTNKPNLPKM